MPKSYEDEIRELLKGMDRFPGEGGRNGTRGGGAPGGVPNGGARNGSPRRSAPARSPFSGLGGWRRWDAQRIMGGALILMLFAWIMQGPWTRGFPELRLLAGYISLASVALFLVALVLFFRNGAFGRMSNGGGQQPRWRGQVIEFPRRGGPMTGLRNWWRRVTSRVSRRPSRPTGPFRGRDTYQW